MATTATETTLAELLEAAGATPADKKYTWGNIASAQRTLESRGPDLARLVVTLETALREEMLRNPLHRIAGHAVRHCDQCKALAAVKELKL